MTPEQIIERIRAQFAAAFLSGEFSGFEGWYSYSEYTQGTEGQAMTMDDINKVLDSMPAIIKKMEGR